MQLDLDSTQEPTSLPEATAASAQGSALVPEASALAPLLSENKVSRDYYGNALSEEVRRVRRGILYGLGGLSILGAVVILARSIVGADAQLILSGTMSPLLVILSLFVVNSRRKPRLHRRDLTARVVDLHDVRLIDALIDALSLGDTKTQEIAMDGLCNLLPLLRSTDEALLTPSICAKLCFLLSLPVESPLHKNVRALFQPASHRSIDFRVAILQAFEHVGDSQGH